MLAIAMNTDERPAICALCHELHHPQVGPSLIMIHTEEPVCRRCGREHEPELTALLDLARVAEGYAGELFAVTGGPE